MARLKIFKPKMVELNHVDTASGVRYRMHPVTEAKAIIVNKKTDQRLSDYIVNVQAHIDDEDIHFSKELAMLKEDYVGGDGLILDDVLPAAATAVYSAIDVDTILGVCSDFGMDVSGLN